MAIVNNKLLIIRKGFAIFIGVIFFVITLAIFFALTEIPHKSANTSNWETYRNEKYGFEFKYPNDKEIEILENEVNIYSNFTRQYDGAQPEKVFYFGVNYDDSCGNNDDPGLFAEKIFVDFKFANIKHENGEGGDYEFIILEDRNKRICFSGNKKSKNGFIVDRDILNTFKFLK